MYMDVNCSYFHERKLSAEVLLGHKKKFILGT